MFGDQPTRRPTRKNQTPRHASVNIRILLIAGLALLIGLAVTACSGDGRELAQPEDWQTTTTRPPPPTSAPLEEISASGVILSSPEFAPGDNVPADSTCDGRNVFPTLEWSPVPAGTSEVALTLTDQTNSEEPVLIWLMAGIDPNRAQVESGVLPDGAVETLNDYGNPGYGSPCLDELVGQRDLQFRMYMMDSPSGLEANAAGNTSWDVLRSSAFETASLLARIDGQG